MTTMSRRAFASTLAAVLIAALPATAFADGAGDEQYQDPLAAPTTPKKTPKKPSNTTTTTVAAPTQTAAAAPTSATAGTGASGSESSSQQELPRTGAPADLIGLGGAAMIAAGLALRRRTAG